MSNPYGRQQTYDPAGIYKNDAGSRYQENLAKGLSLLNDPPMIVPGIDSKSGYSAIPKSNYTQSEGGSDYDYFKQPGEMRKKWQGVGGGGNEQQNFQNDVGFFGMGDQTEIGVINVQGGSRRGSLKGIQQNTPNSRERLNNPVSSTSLMGYGGGYAQRDPYENQSQLKRPPTSGMYANDQPRDILDQIPDNPLRNRAQMNIQNQQFSEAHSYFDRDRPEDDAISHLQSEFGGMSQFGVQPMMNQPSYNQQIPQQETGSRRRPVTSGISRPGENRPDSGSLGRPPTGGTSFSGQKPVFLQDQTDQPRLARQGTMAKQPSIDPATGEVEVPIFLKQNQTEEPKFRSGITLTQSANKRQQEQQRELQKRQSALSLIPSVMDDKTTTGQKSPHSIPTRTDDQTMKYQYQQSVPSSIQMQPVPARETTEQFMARKKREEIEKLEKELAQERMKSEHQKQQSQQVLDQLKEKNSKDLQNIEESNETTIHILQQEKQQKMEALIEQVAREKQKMEVMHSADLETKERQHQRNLEQQKIQLEKESKNLEAQLQQQAELKEILEKVQQRTHDLSELVQGGLKQSEEDLRRRENEIFKRERQLHEEEEIETALNEKKLEEEEKRLDRLRDDMQRSKNMQEEELSKLIEQKRYIQLSYESQEFKLKNDERLIKEKLLQEQIKLENEMEKKKNKGKLMEMELTSKQHEIDNFKEIIHKIKIDFESEFRDKKLRQIQVRKLDLENRKTLLAEKEQDLKKRWRLLENKRLIVQSDWNDFKNKIEQFAQEKKDFTEQAAKIEETAQKLQEERGKVMEEKAAIDFEREQLEKYKTDLDIEASLLHSEQIRAEELEHELAHREKMLQMLKYSRDQKLTDINIPPYSSCPSLKMDPRQYIANSVQFQQQPLDCEGHNHSPGGQGPQYYQPEGLGLNTNHFGVNQHHQHVAAPSSEMHFKRTFDYNQYMHDLQQRLGSSSQGGSPNKYQPSKFHDYISDDIQNFSKNLQNQQQNQQQYYTFSGEKQQKNFRQKIQEKIGQANNMADHGSQLSYDSEIAASHGVGGLHPVPDGEDSEY